MTIDPAVAGAIIAAAAAAIAKVYADVKRERDFFRDKLLASLGATEDAIKVATKATRG